MSTFRAILVSLFVFVALAGASACQMGRDPVSTSLGHVVPKADGSLPKTHFLTAPVQTIEVDQERSTTFLAGNIGFLVAAVAVFLALRVPLLTKTMWTLAIVAAGYGVFSIMFATFYTYIIVGLFILSALAAVVALIYVAKHQFALKTATTLADDLKGVAAPLGESLQGSSIVKAAEAQAKAGVQKLVDKIRAL